MVRRNSVVEFGHSFRGSFDFVVQHQAVNSLDVNFGRAIGGRRR
jgi:hypothetical protein